MVEVVVLGSGSSGNCTLVRSPRGTLLIDAGFSGRETLRRLRLVDQDPTRIDAVLVTHEHADHISGLRAVLKHLGGHAAVFASRGTLQAVVDRAQRGYGPARDEDPFEFASGIFAVEPGTSFAAAGFAVTPFRLPHDAAEPLGFVLAQGTARFGFATDLGHVPQQVGEQLAACEALVFEANHDRKMLLEGRYPPHLKRRIESPQGHLSNAQAAAVLPLFARAGVRQVVLGHLSRENNDPSLVRADIHGALVHAGQERLAVSLSTQDNPAPPIRL